MDYFERLMHSVLNEKQGSDLPLADHFTPRELAAFILGWEKAVGHLVYPDKMIEKVKIEDEIN